MERSPVRYVWVFNCEGSATGVWVTSSLNSQSNRNEIVAEAIASKVRTSEDLGKDLGFSKDLELAFSSGDFREVENDYTEVARGTAFTGGAFLMKRGARAPSEMKNPSTLFEVRQAMEEHGLIQLRPETGGKWWQFWK